MRIGSQDVGISLSVADIEDSAILRMDFLSDVDAKIDLVQQQLVINEKKIDCCSESGLQLSLRCITRRLVVIEPQCKAGVPSMLFIVCESSNLVALFAFKRFVHQQNPSVCARGWPCSCANFKHIGQSTNHRHCSE